MEFSIKCNYFVSLSIIISAHNLTFVCDVKGIRPVLTTFLFLHQARSKQKLSGQATEDIILGQRGKF